MCGRYNLCWELANDAGVQEAVDPALRRCLFASERPPPPFAAYSVGACVSTCRTQLQRDVCNCTFIDAPGAAPEEECDLWGVLCQVLKGELFTKLEPLWELDASKAQLVCDCPAGCEEVYINRVAESKNTVLDRSVGVTQLILDSLPTERFRRNLVKTPLDVVVSLGGTAGLFLGASILSIVELLYYLLLRPFGGDNDTNEDARISSKNSYDVRLRRPRLIPSRRPQGLLI